MHIGQVESREGGGVGLSRQQVNPPSIPITPGQGSLRSPPGCLGPNPENPGPVDGKGAVDAILAGLRQADEALKPKKVPPTLHEG